MSNHKFRKKSSHLLIMVRPTEHELEKHTTKHKHMTNAYVHMHNDKEKNQLIL